MSDSFEPYENMELYDEFIPAELFSEFIARMPQVCVDLVLETTDGILLAKREIDPPIWFWPGSRLYKGEQLDEAAHRIAGEELGIEITIHDQYGPYAHFWEDSAVDGSPSRHTVNPVFHVTPATPEYEIVLDDQHSDYRLITDVEADLHEYVRLYLNDIDFAGYTIESADF
jgi:colanic acid biosynthesis protein WcaH